MSDVPQPLLCLPLDVGKAMPLEDAEEDVGVVVRLEVLVGGLEQSTEIAQQELDSSLVIHHRQQVLLKNKDPIPDGRIRRRAPGIARSYPPHLVCSLVPVVLRVVVTEHGRQWHGLLQVGRHQPSPHGELCVPVNGEDSEYRRSRLSWFYPVLEGLGQMGDHVLDVVGRSLDRDLDVVCTDVSSRQRYEIRVLAFALCLRFFQHDQHLLRAPRISEEPENLFLLIGHIAHGYILLTELQLPLERMW